MLAITIQPQLKERLEQLASEQSTRPEKLLERLVRDYLHRAERDSIRAEIQAFHRMHDRLVEKYLEQYVAIYHGDVVDQDHDFQALHSRVRQRFGRQPVLLRRVAPDPQREWVFRSPRVERG
jgi:hypothetical protein